MMVQLHLALVMAIDASLLILDEPTLGLDILFRKRFFEQLISDYYDEERTIIISTHQVDEVQHILTHVMFLNHGKLVMSKPVMYVVLFAPPGNVAVTMVFAPLPDVSARGVAPAGYCPTCNSPISL